MTEKFVFYKVELRPEEVLWKEMVLPPEGYDSDKLGVKADTCILLDQGSSLGLVEPGQQITYNFILNMVLQRQKTLTYFIGVAANTPHIEKVFISLMEDNLLHPYGIYDHETPVKRTLN